MSKAFFATQRTLSPMFQSLLFVVFTLVLSADSAVDITSINDVEITMKSKLNKDKDRLLVKIELPEADEISFELYTRDGDIQHRWDEQQLSAGNHDLALPLPLLYKTTYIVKMVGHKYELKQLLFNQ